MTAENECFSGKRKYPDDKVAKRALAGDNFGSCILDFGREETKKRRAAQPLVGVGLGGSLPANLNYRISKLVLIPKLVLVPPPSRSTRALGWHPYIIDTKRQHSNEAEGKLYIMEVHNIISFGARVNLWICILITAMFGVFFIFIGLKGFMVQKPYVVSIRSLMAFQIAYTGMGILACLESVFLKLFYLPMHDIFLSVLAIPALIGAIAILWKYSSGYFVVGLPLYVLEEMVHLDNIKLKDDGNGLIKIDAVGKTEKELSNLVRVMREQFVNYGGCVYLSASKLYLVGGIVLLLFVVGLVGVSFMNEGLNFLW